MPLLFAFLVFPWPLAALRGFVIAKLWLWFVVPQFGADPIRITFAIGISSLVGLCIVTPPKREKNLKYEWDDLMHEVVCSVFISLISLICGWIVTLFI